MIDKNDAFKLLQQHFPDFFSSETWIHHLKMWDEDDPGFGNNICMFSEYAKDLFKEHRIEELRPMMDFAERMLQEGDQEVQNAFATCFLENILNVVPSDIPAQDFVPLLGKESREYCIAWDKFTGVMTEGLHDDLA